MEAGPTFDALLSQPGPSSAPAMASPPSGGVMLNDSVKQVQSQRPQTMLAAAAAASWEAVKRLKLQAKGAAQHEQQ